MKITTGLLAGVAVLAMAQTAHAAPKVAGKYILMSFSQCQARFTATPDGSGGTLLNTVTGGEINIAVGSITFPDTPASTGTATLEMSIVSGAALRINTTGPTITTHLENAPGTFTINATNSTFTFDPNDDAAMTWTYRAGDYANTNVNGVARTLYMTRRENAQCLSAVTATKVVQP
jgi:hypothetical protein